MVFSYFTCLIKTENEITWVRVPVEPALLITRNGLRIKVRNPRNYDVTTANQNARNVEMAEIAQI